MTDWISVKEVAADIGVDPQSIRVQARIDPKALGFNICVIGSRIYIPREGYNNWKRGTNNAEDV